MPKYDVCNYRMSAEAHSKKFSVSSDQSKKPKHLRSLSTAKPILQVPKIIYPPIIYAGVNVTPVCLNPHIYEAGKERQLNVLDNISREASLFRDKSSLSRMDSQKFQQTLLQVKHEGDTQTFLKTYVTSGFDEEMFMAMMNISSKMSSLSHERSDQTNELFFSSSVPLIEKPIPKHISLILQETDTIFLLDIRSSTVSKDSTDSTNVLEDNKLYDFLTLGKGRNRKVSSVATQTRKILKKSREIENKKSMIKNHGTFVSHWEMYDTFLENPLEKNEEEMDEFGDLISEIFYNDKEEAHQLNDNSSIESYRLSKEDKRLHKILKSKNFLDALLIIERILGNNTYNEQQKKFKGIPNYTKLNNNMEYKYTLNLLWTYNNEATKGKCVTAICLNSHSEDIIAVSYGKHYYNDKSSNGVVLVWNIKNPQQPERSYYFAQPVTAIAFSLEDPTILAIGFYNGNLKILNIQKHENEAIRIDVTTSFEPIWSIIYFYQNEKEFLMVSFGDGTVRKYETKSNEFKNTQIMTTRLAEGALKGIYYLKKCEERNISIMRNEEPRCLAMHPQDPFIYYIGTSGGIIHKCSTNYYNEHMDLHKAHDGSVHTLKFNPFANKLYVTCGDDFRARIWADGIFEPLVTSEPSMLPVLDIDWNPLYPTVLASIRGSEILIWDFQRKMNLPQSGLKSPTNSNNTVCKFSSSGRCLFIGDVTGNVYSFSLEHMPIPPFFPEDLILHSLKGLLNTKPSLFVEIKKLGSLNFQKEKHFKYFK